MDGTALTDTAWIFSSIIQSTAAFVAILGGFITGSVLQLVSQRSMVEDEYQQLKSEKTLWASRLQVATIERDRFLTIEAIDDNIERIVRSPSTYETKVRAKNALFLSDVDDEAFEEVWDRFANGMHGMRMEISKRIDKFAATETDFDTWALRVDLPKAYADSWRAELVFRHEREVWLHNNDPNRTSVRLE